MGNARVLKDGFAKGLRMIEHVLRDSLADAADKLLVRVSSNRQFVGFTGNTQTSYACGVYINGVLVHVSIQKNWNDAPRRMKVRRGRIVYLSNPYEGRPRAVRGMADIETDYGITLSLRQLSEYKAPRRGVALMMTTGTEYSVYIEQSMSLDVLTNTYRDAPRILESSWKKIVS